MLLSGANDPDKLSGVATLDWSQLTGVCCFSQLLLKESAAWIA